jgi:hypothetical protein
VVSVRDVDAAGRADAGDLRRSEELLDRLGRRAPGPGDLDDPLVAALARWAGDVDLCPVPVSVSRQALVDVGGWPPRVLARRQAAGVTAATALVVTGCLVAFCAQGGVLDPVSGVRTVVQERTGHAPDRPTLLDQVGAARAALRHGDPVAARAILDEVAGRLPALPSKDRGIVAAQLSAARKALGPASPSAGSPRRTSSSDAARDDGSGSARPPRRRRRTATRAAASRPTPTSTDPDGRRPAVDRPAGVVPRPG